MRVLRKSRHAVCIALSFVLLVCMAGLPVNAAPSNAEAAPINVETAPINVETALTEFTVTISLTEKEKYAGVEMSVELSDGIKYVSHEMEPSFTSLYQYNGTRHLIGGMTTEGKNVFSGKLEVGVLKLNYQGNANETISISPAVSRYDGDGKPVSTPKKEQTIQISRPGSEANPGGENSGTGGSSGGGKTIILDEQNANIEIVLDDAVPLAGLPSFTDISGHWAESYILSLAAQQVVSGVRNGKFSPNGKLTRAEFVQMFYNAFGSGAQPAGPLTFGDTVPGGWYTNAIAWATDNGIVTGYTEKAFGPNDPIRRQDITVIMSRLASTFDMDLKAGQKQAAFADDQLIGGYAKAAVYQMQSASIIAGKGNNIFDPLGNTTRAEAAKILYIILEKAGKIDPAYTIPS